MDKMKIVRIIVAIITLLIFLGCWFLAIMTFIAGEHMVGFAISVVASLMGYFVVNDYMRFFKGQ